MIIKYLFNKQIKNHNTPKWSRMLPCFVISALLCFHAVAKPQPMIIDTDMAAEDWTAILYLLNNPKVDVKAITVAGTGEAHCIPGVENAIKLLQIAKHPLIPVACGRAHPIEGGHPFPDEWRLTQDAFYPTQQSIKPQPASPKAAGPLLIETLYKADEKVRIVAIGPLTNLADAIELDHKIIDKIDNIYVMGGALFHPGNIATVVPLENETAEWNLFADPISAEKLFSSNAPITMVGLDATQYTPINTQTIDLLGDKLTTDVGKEFHLILSIFKDAINSQQWHFWDTLTAAAAVENELIEIMDAKVSVLTTPLQRAGQTVIANDGNTIKVAIKADNDAFLNELIKTLNYPPNKA